MNIIIPIGKSAKKIKSVVHHSLIKISKDELLIQYQIRVLKAAIPKGIIFLLVDQHSKTILEAVQGMDVEIVCEQYNSLASSINEAIWFAGLSNTLVVMGDIIFNKHAIGYITDKNQTSILVDSKNLFNKSEIGLWHKNGIVQHMSYSLPLKWGHMIYGTSDFWELFRNNFDPKLLTYEILNSIVDLHPVHIVQNKKIKALEIDKPKDIRLARQIFG